MVHRSNGNRTTLGVHNGQGWVVDRKSNTPMPADSVTRAFIIGHDLHMIYLDPTTRYGNPLFARDTVFNNVPVVSVAFKDDFGSDVYMFYSTSDNLPVGMQNIDHSDPKTTEIAVMFDEWIEQENLTIFTRATFLDGENVFTYDYDRIVFNRVADSLLADPFQTD